MSERQPRILLLEDDETLRELVAETLTDEGWSVESHAAFAPFESALRDRQWDAAVADFWGTSQSTLLDAERQQMEEMARLAPLVLLTGRAWTDQVTPGELGASAIVRKPFDIDGLVALLGKIVQVEP